MVSGTASLENLEIQSEAAPHQHDFSKYNALSFKIHVCFKFYSVRCQFLFNKYSLLIEMVKMPQARTSGIPADLNPCWLLITDDVTPDGKAQD